MQALIKVSGNLINHRSAAHCHRRACSDMVEHAEQAVDKLRLRVLDAHALGDPGFLGETALDLGPLQLQPNAPPVNIWLPLQVLSFAAEICARVRSACCWATGCCGWI